MSVFGKDSQYYNKNDSSQKKRPQRVNYSIDGDVGKTSRRAERAKRVDYTYQGNIASNVTEIQVDIPQQAEKPHAKAFDQNSAPLPKPKKKTEGMQQTVIPLGTINVPLTVVEGKKKQSAQSVNAQQSQHKPQPQSQPQPRPAKQHGIEARKNNTAKQSNNKQTTIQKNRPLQETTKQPRPAKPQAIKRKPPVKKAEPKQLSYGEARRRRMKRSIIAAVAAAVLIIIGIIISVTVVFKIETIKINGESIYTDEQIINACGFSYGDNLFKFALDSASDSVEAQLPYLESVTIRRYLPGTVQINITPSVETYTMNTDMGWAVLSSSLKVLRIDAEPASGLTLILGATAQAPAVGQQIAFEEADRMSALNTIITDTAKYELAPVNEIDVTDLLEITVLYDNRIRILFGTINDMENKTDYAHDLVIPGTLAESLSENERGTLDISGRNAEGRMVAVWLAGEP